MVSDLTDKTGLLQIIEPPVFVPYAALRRNDLIDESGRVRASVLAVASLQEMRRVGDYQEWLEETATAYPEA